MDHGSYDEHQAYCEAHCIDEPEHLVNLRRASYQKLMRPRMNSGLLQGRFLSMISYLFKPERILEIGTFSGYAALCLAEGLSSEGKLISIEVNDELAAFHDRHLFTSPNAEKIKVIYGAALTEIPRLSEFFDLIYLDADKENYSVYYPLLKSKMKRGSVLLVDNMLWEGKVLQEQEAGDVQTESILALTKMIKEDPEMEQVLVPMRDGLMMVRKLV